MKILHTADWHLGKRLEHVPRLPEQHDVLDEICRIAEAEDVDMVLIAGDIFDQPNPPIEALELFYATLRRLSKDGRRAVVGIAGNHDAPDRIAAPDPLARANGIFLLGYPAGVLRPTTLPSGLSLTESGPGWARFRFPHIDFSINLILTPYANGLRLRKAVSPENSEESVTELLVKHWEEAAASACQASGINILMTHLMLLPEGEKAPAESEDERTILTPGGLQGIPTRHLPAGLDYVAVGHLHRKQQLKGGPCPVVYAGSPLAYSMSEAGQQKEVTILEATPGQISYRAVALNTGKPLERKRFEDVNEALTWLADHPDSWVELTMATSGYLRAADRQALFKAHKGIVSLIPEVDDEAMGHLHKKHVDITQDMETLFQGFFESKKGQKPSEELLTLFREVLGED